jgi:hypothetical protein
MSESLLMGSEFVNKIFFVAVAHPSQSNMREKTTNLIFE